MKAILISINPKWVAKILNGEKTIEIRKKFPKDFVGWVYIYCTKDKLTLSKYFYLDSWSYDAVLNYNYAKQFDMAKETLNGKVVARFWCDKVEDFEFCEFSKYKDNLELYNECIRKDNELCKKACISCVQMVQYLDTKAIGKDMFGKAIHITKLEIFDKPKEISEFYKVGCKEYFTKHAFVNHPNFRPIYESHLKQFQLTRVPQSWCYIEI